MPDGCIYPGGDAENISPVDVFDLEPENKAVEEVLPEAGENVTAVKDGQ